MTTRIKSPDGIRTIVFDRIAKPLTGMVLLPLKPIVDGRGELTELWSAPWIKTKDVAKPAHIYQSATDYGVVKAWHLHKKHTDQFAMTRGKIQVVCADARHGTETFGKYFSILAGAHNPVFLKIPPGILHGWKALSVPEALVLNMQTDVYDPNDELRMPWDSILQDVWEPVFR
jgi:dTDP-4-dehydrorhamnose 3,5-epimerase